MTIQEVPNIPTESVELFEAAGLVHVDTILNLDLSHITQKIVTANNILDIIDTPIDQHLVSSWLSNISKQASPTVSPTKPNRTEQPDRQPPNIISSETISKFASAIPISWDFIQESQIDVAELPLAKGIVAGKNDHTINKLPRTTSDRTDKVSEAKTSEQPITLSRNNIKKINSVSSNAENIAANSSVNKNDRIKEINKGVNPQSRSFIKGVLHKQPSSFKIGSKLFIISHLIIILSLSSLVLLLVDKEEYNWAIWAPLFTLVGLFMAFISAQLSSCPVCNQKQYTVKRCNKHKDAHYLPLVGHRLATAFHATFFKWFRCIFCGSSIRLKE